MLGKLIKHEWKVLWKVPALLIGILMLLAVAAASTFALPIWDSEWIGLPMSGAMIILLFYFALIATSLGIMIYTTVRYYKSMFTDEGYLTHTLPVTARQLLLSKVITMSAWNLIAAAAVLLSLVVFGGVTVLALTIKDGSAAKELLEGILAFREVLDHPFMNGFGTFMVCAIAMTLVTSVSGSTIVTGSINLGQMVRTHRILGAIGAYFAINTVLQIVCSMFMIPVMTKMVSDESFLYTFEKSPFSFYTLICVFMTVVYLVVAVGFYLLSEYLLRKKLDLE